MALITVCRYKTVFCVGAAKRNNIDVLAEMFRQSVTNFEVPA